MSKSNPLSKDDITQIALNSGFELKQLEDGTMGLRPYVFLFANNLIEQAALHQEDTTQVVYFPATMQSCSEGSGFVVTFRDVPEAITQGDSFAEAIEYAEDALETCKDFYEDRPYPKPSAPIRGDVMVGVKLKVDSSTSCSCGLNWSNLGESIDLALEDLPEYMRNLGDWDTSNVSNFATAFSRFANTNSDPANEKE